MDYKKKLSAVDLEKLIDETLNEMYKKYDVRDNCTLKIKKFNEIWTEKFVNNIDSSSGDFNNKDGKYDNPIIQTIYDKFRRFYLEDCPKIEEKINEIKSKINNILNEG